MPYNVVFAGASAGQLYIIVWQYQDVRVFRLPPFKKLGVRWGGNLPMTSLLRLMRSCLSSS